MPDDGREYTWHRKAKYPPPPEVGSVVTFEDRDEQPITMVVSHVRERLDGGHDITGWISGGRWLE